MDCYIASLHGLINDDHVTASEFAFLSNYSVSRAWLDGEMARSFDVPIIYPSWFPNTSAIQALYPQLRCIQAGSFEEYLDVIRKRLERGSVVTPVDRYYLDYIEPRRHMGAHYILICDKIEGAFEYFDFYDQSEHLVSIDELKQWTTPRQNPVQYMGYSVLFTEPTAGGSRPGPTLEEVLGRRISMLCSTIATMRDFKRGATLPARAQRFCLKIALGGMTDSDFNKKNGRQENRDFFSGRGMMFSALVESMIIGYYQALAQMFGWVYAKEVKITRWWWCAFIDLYIAGLRIEFLRYKLLRAAACRKRVGTRQRDLLEAVS